ncbi:helix-turn-helix domain-containing protein [Flavivirga algicola]|uniref:AraC family transcriptional regulator n=1 Tax=Flavivirga algicola TaxID=2729136 RepID=A0ABX1S3R4_9FLAO|nr:helix-turn-helix domain-containing protein [Flavivirga algicola]NMH89074.1 AraC family transcriptional regulator [Flavivirga algicola]
MKLIIDFIIITGLVLNIFVLLGLLKIKGKQAPHKILIIMWGFIFLSLIHFYAKLHGMDLLYIMTFIFANGVRIFLAPLIFVYIKSIFQPYKSLIKKNLVHFTPFLIYLIIYILPSVVNHLAEKEVFQHVKLIDATMNQGLVLDLISLVYLILSARLFLVSKQHLKHQYSNINAKDFLWIRNFLFCFIIIIILDLILVFLALWFNLNPAELGYITIVFLVASMIYLGYYGLTQSTIFLPDFLVDKRAKPREINISELSGFQEKLEYSLNTDKPYLQPGLTLSVLAEHLGISDRKLSMVINDIMKTSFYDLINKYRIEEAKKKLASSDYDKYSITGIAEICGFNSKSSFYRIFKKETGMTPTQYKNSIDKVS